MGSDDESSKTMASTSKKENKNESLKSMKSAAAAGMAVYGFAENVADKYINLKINTVSLTTGHTELQDKLRFQYGVLKKALDVSKYIMVGSMIGGGLAGRAVGAVIGITSQLIDYSVKYTELQTKKELERVTMNLNNIRIGTRQDRTNRSI